MSKKIEEILRSNYRFVPESEREDIKEMTSALLSGFKEMVEKGLPEKGEIDIFAIPGRGSGMDADWNGGRNSGIEECRANLLKAIEEEGE